MLVLVYSASSQTLSPLVYKHYEVRVCVQYSKHKFVCVFSPPTVGSWFGTWSGQTQVPMQQALLPTEPSPQCLCFLIATPSIYWFLPLLPNGEVELM